MNKLYRHAYISGSVLFFLGLIWLDDYVHNSAKVFVGLVATSPYWIKYFSVSVGEELDISCEHEWTILRDHTQYSDSYIVMGCTKCGRSRKNKG